MEFLKRPRFDLEKFEPLVIFNGCFQILLILPTYSNLHENYIFLYHSTGHIISRIGEVFRDRCLYTTDITQCLDKAQRQQLKLLLIQGLRLKILTK